MFTPQTEHSGGGGGGGGGGWVAVPLMLVFYVTSRFSEPLKPDLPGIGRLSAAFLSHSATENFATVATMDMRAAWFFFSDATDSS